MSLINRIRKIPQILFILLIFTSCTPSTPMITPTVTITPTLVPTNTSIPSPTPTPVTQILGRVFKEGWDSMGMSSNRNTGNLNSNNTHVDAIVPKECRQDLNDCPIYSPIDGVVWEIYSVGNPKGSEGQVISIHLTSPPQGIEEVLKEFGISPKNITRYSIHVGHIVNLNSRLNEGVQVKKGELLAEGVNYDPDPGIAFVLYVWEGNNIRQINPCSVPNTISFCGVCIQYDGYCPETLENYPNGGIQWWNESDPFWDTHELSIP